MLAPDPVTLRAVKAAARALCPLVNGVAQESPHRCRDCQLDEIGRCFDPDKCLHLVPEVVAAIATYHDAKGEHLAAARVRRCWTQPEPNDDAAFLATLLDRVRARDRVSLADVARLRRLADWADAPPCPGWDGTLDPGETERAVDDARRRMDT